MSQELTDHLRKLSSRNGRYWLKESRVANEQSQNGPSGAHGLAADGGFKTSRIDGGDRLPFQSTTSSKSAVHESVVVSIPNVADEKADAIVPDAVPAKPESSPVEKVSTAPQPELPITAQSANVSIVETTEATETDASTVRMDDAVAASRSNQTPALSESVVKIADEIVAKYPPPAAAIIMFVGSEAKMHTDETCARVAAELASRDLGKVLLVDSDFESRRLTSASGMNSHAGLSEVMNIAFPWERAVLSSGSSKLDFVPAGNCPHDRWNPKEQLRNALAAMKAGYGYVCVSVGEAHGHAASTWADLSDGTFLLVSLRGSNEDIAVSAVAQMKSSGARVLGCVVADVEAA